MVAGRKATATIFSSVAQQWCDKEEVMSQTREGTVIPTINQAKILNIITMKLYVTLSCGNMQKDAEY